MRTSEIFKSKKIALLIVVTIISILYCDVVFAQTTRLSPGFYPVGSPEYKQLFGSEPTLRASSEDATLDYAVAVAPRVSISYEKDNITNVLWYVQLTSKSGNTIINPYQVLVRTNVPDGDSVNVQYSLYTYKSTFPQIDPWGQKRRLTYGGVEDCTTSTTFTTQADIDQNLDKIVTLNDTDTGFDYFKETQLGLRVIDWDGKTSDGMPVRDCVIIVANDKDTGKFLGYGYSIRATQGYETLAYPGVKYTPIQGAVRADITLAYEKPVRRIWAILGESGCMMGNPDYMTFDVVNQGGPAIMAAMNSYYNAALAIKELDLENPVATAEDGLIKTFRWDIQGVTPPYEGYRYLMIIVMEADDGYGNIVPTVTGLNDGYIFADNSNLIEFPMPLGEEDYRLIPNGNFLSTQYWVLGAYNGSAATWSVADGKATINITAIGANSWEPQFVHQNIKLEKGQKYRFSFDASAGGTKDIDVVFQQSSDSFSTYFYSGILSLTTETKSFSFDFEMTSSSDPNTQLAFQLGRSTQSVTLSNVKLINITETGIGELSSKASNKSNLRVNVLPNSTVNVNFTATENGETELMLYNLTGSLVASAKLYTFAGKNYSQTFDQRNLPSGSYIVWMNSNGKREVQKVIVR